MKHLCLVACLFFVVGVVQSQNSFANISFDGPERYQPKGSPKTSTEFRAMKEKIRAFPTRLDFRLDYMNELYNSENWIRLTDEAVALVSHSFNNEHNWMWDSQVDAIGENAKAFMLSTVQDYVLMLYLSNDETNRDRIISISDAVLAHQPDHRDFLTYPAMAYADQGDFESALPYLHKAERAHREDGTVAILLADNYFNLKNKNMALSYYKKAVRYGSESEIIAANKAIELIESRN